MGKVIKIVGDIYSVLDSNQVLSACCLKTIKKNRVVVGDDVELKKDEFSSKYIITKVFPRKNCLPRPVVANIDKLLIVIANTPKPDLLLVDKLVIYAQILGIEPIIVINKSDLSDADFVKSIMDQYLHLKVFLISATQNNGIDKLENYIKNSVCAVCGQSAVGKSSLINALIPSAQLETQGLSAKIERGKHTTRVNQIFVSSDICIADTPGFSNLELELDYRELSAFYPEFDNYLDDCRYLDCSHVGEGKDCGVISAVDAQKINYDRYSRYVELYKKLKENWEKKYD